MSWLLLRSEQNVPVYQKRPTSGTTVALETKDIFSKNFCIKIIWLCYTKNAVKQLRIALYARVSTKDKGQDYENQLRELRAFVERKADEGWILCHEYTDRASGKSADRPQFRRLFEDASRKEFDLILFWSLDRFSREGVYETLGHLQRLSSHGIDWWSYREEYLRSIGPFRDAVLSILACIARQERVRLSERVQAGLSRAKAQGRVLGRPKAAVRSERVLALHARGLSTREIASETGVSHMTVSRILAAKAV